MNLNELAVELTKKEGKKVQVNIAQTKEMVNGFCSILSEMSVVQLIPFIIKMREHGSKLNNNKK